MSKSTPDQVKLSIRRLTLSGDIGAGSVGDTMKSIHWINHEGSAQRIELWLNTSGGSNYDGLALIDTMLLSNIPVDVVAVGHCMSIGVGILQAGQVRYATPHTCLAIHFTTSRGGPAPAKEVVEQAKDNLRLERQLNSFSAKRIGMTRTAYEKLMKDSLFMTPKVAKEYGFIDKIIKTPH